MLARANPNIPVLTLPAAVHWVGVNRREMNAHRCGKGLPDVSRAPHPRDGATTDDPAAVAPGGESPRRQTVVGSLDIADQRGHLSNYRESIARILTPAPLAYPAEEVLDRA